MRSAGAFLLIALFSTVRAEPVEARDQGAAPVARPSTGSGRTEEKDKSPVDAERAFAADARAIGQWTAFRKWSTDDAVMFTPQPVNAQDFLKDRKDPPNVIDWWPTASYISCDGKLAVNTGGWKRPDGSVGYFSTVWQRQPDGGWRWIVDGGDTLKIERARPTQPKIIRAKCPGIFFDRTIALRAGERGGYSDDFTLSWRYAVKSDGSRTFAAAFLDNAPGLKFRTVIDDKIPAPPQ